MTNLTSFLKGRIFLFVFSALLFASGISYPGGGVGNDFKYYRNETYDYMLYYPKDWEFEESNNIVNISNLNLVSNPNLESKVELKVIEDFVDKDLSEEENLAKLKTYLDETYPDFEWILNEVNSMKGFKVEYDNRDNAISIKARSQKLFLIWKTYVLNFDNIKNDYSQGSTKVQTVVDTTNLDNALFRAIRSNDLSKVKKLLKAGANIEAKDYYERTPLMVASEEGFISIMTFLLEKDAKIEAQDEFGNTPIILAADNGQVEAIYFLADKGAEIDRGNYKERTAFMYAVMYDQLEAARALLGLGADIEARDYSNRTVLMRIACIWSSDYEHFIDSVSFLIQEGANLDTRGPYNKTPIMCSAATKKNKVIELLVEGGANINAVDKNGRTALFRISYYEKYNEISKLLIDLNIDITIKGKRGKTAFIEAVYGGNLDLVKLLIQHGADINAQKNNGWTALMVNSYFAPNNHIEIFNLLKNANADPNKKGTGLETALMLASREGHLEIVRLLIGYGANLNDRDIEGRTALGYAYTYGHDDVAKVLIKAGGQE